MSSLRAVVILWLLASFPAVSWAQERRPVVGIEADVVVDPVTGAKTAHVADAYLEAVHRAGGIPRILSPLEMTAARALEGLDAVVLTGGPDIPPGEYGEAPITKDATVDPARLAFGKELIRLAFEGKVPILGICYGNQLLNVARGGKLVQDIPSRVEGALEHRDGEHDTHHPIAVEPGSALGSEIGASALVNSFHHQAVAVPGAGLRVVARSSDGVAEATEGTAPGHWVLGVQWHPERLGDVAAGLGIWRRLVAAAREFGHAHEEGLPAPVRAAERSTRPGATPDPAKPTASSAEADRLARIRERGRELPRTGMEQVLEARVESGERRDRAEDR